MKILGSGQAYLFYSKSFSVQYTYFHLHLQIKKVLMDRNSFEDRSFEERHAIYLTFRKSQSLT